MSSKFKVQGSKSPRRSLSGAGSPPALVQTGVSPVGPAPRASRPFVFLNVAMSADGKIAPASRRYVPFGSPRDTQLLYTLRAEADAIICGARTIEQSATLLSNGPERFIRQRRRRGLAPYNLRVIVTGSGSVNPAAPLFQHRFSPILILTTERAGPKRLAALRRVADAVRVCGKKEINFPSALRWLQTEWGVQRLLCEGGGELNGALLLAGLVDEIHVTVCPMIFGGRTAPTLADGVGVARLADALPLELKSSRRVGDEMFLCYRVLNSRPVAIAPSPPPRSSPHLAADIWLRSRGTPAGL